MTTKLNGKSTATDLFNLSQLGKLVLH